MTEKQTGFVELPGARLYYESWGAGKPVVMLHAGIADHRIWAGQCEELSKYFRVITPDLRGYGWSATQEVSYRFCDDIYLLIRYLGLQTVGMVGCSIGGRTVLDLMITHPEVVERAILVAPALRGYEYGDARTLAIDAAIEKFVAEGNKGAAVESTVDMWVVGPKRKRGSVDAKVLALARLMITENYEAMMRGFAETGIDFDVIASLEKIKIPTLVMIGDADLPDMQEISRIITAGIPGAKRQLIPGAAHLPNLDQGGLFNRKIKEFFGGDNAGAP